MYKKNLKSKRTQRRDRKKPWNIKNTIYYSRKEIQVYNYIALNSPILYYCQMVHKNMKLYTFYEMLLKKWNYRKAEGNRNNVNQENINQTKVEVSKLPSEKVDLQGYVGITESSHNNISFNSPEYMMILNLHAPDKRASKHIKQKLKSSLL